MLKPTLEVVAGMIRCSPSQWLIAQRSLPHEFAGMWEFPGGKIQLGEDAQHALLRELQEELGIRVQQSRLFYRVQYEYAHHRVNLQFWEVLTYQGEPRGMEGQTVAWVPQAELLQYRFLPANRPLLAKLILAPLYLITPNAVNLDVWLQNLQKVLNKGPRVVQLRQHELSPQAYRHLAREIAPLCDAYQCPLILNSPDVDLVAAVGAQGLHLSSALLRKTAVNPLGTPYWLGASCHNREEIIQANQLGVDYIVLSPVKQPQSHAILSSPLGWDLFSELAQVAKMPVYALGGVEPGDLGQAQAHGAHGVAGISRFWEYD